MKTLKRTLLLLLLTPLFMFAQNKAYLVHQDNVRPSMISEYEKIAKEFNAVCKEHNPPTSWITSMTSDFKFMFITPLEKFEDIAKRPFTDMAKAMGDEFGAMFDRFDKCYDSHTDYVIILDEGLSYSPDGIKQVEDGVNYRNFFRIYYTPENRKNIKEGMKAVKEMFAAKGSKSNYRVYRSGFGNDESYYMVAISSKDEVDSAQRSKANDELLGPERFKTFDKVMKYATRMEEFTGNIRPDLAYSPKK